MNQTLKGFRLKGTKASPETNSTAYFYEHTSGASLLHLKNEDPHMTFGIGFKTPPEDSTGVAHIVEHTVLAGSRKFKTKEPFMDLLKSSMNTFLNAMTFDHMTLYPVSSMNRKDFKNLVDVYLDAVFFPSIYEKPEIFMQEGWHYEIFKKDEAIRYNGVVYNEMRGAYSSPETNVSYDVARTLNAGSTYGHESGGYPYDIPKLSLEDFQNFHRKYYKPANSLIFLYGDCDLEGLLTFMDQEYLSQFDKEAGLAELNTNLSPLASKALEFYYPADESLNQDDHSFLSYGVNFGRANNLKDYYLHSILDQVLVQSESSPLKKALSEAGLGEDVLTLSANNYFLNFGLAVKNTGAHRLREFEELVEGCLKKLVKEGIDKKLLLAAINNAEFHLREGGGVHKGIYYFIKAMMMHVLNQDPMGLLNFSAGFEDLRKGLDEGIFERAIQERILDNDRKVVACHLPKQDLFEEKDEAVRQELAAFKDSLSQEALDQLILDNEKLLEWQNMAETAEAKATIPSLELSDIPREIPRVEKEMLGEAGAETFFMPYASGDINYLSLSFDLSGLGEEDIFYAGLLGHCLGITDTANYGYSDLNNEIMMHTSGIASYPMVFRSAVDKEYAVRFQVHSAAMGEGSAKMVELVEEVLLRTDFTDSKRLKEIILMVRSSLENNFDYSGNRLVMRRVASFFNQAANYQDRLSGVAFFDGLNDLVAHFENRKAELTEKLSYLAHRIFRKDGLVIAWTAENHRRGELLKLTEDLRSEFPAGCLTGEKPQFSLNHMKEGLTSASGVQYVAKGANFKDLGYEYTGHLTVLGAILSIEYLHNAIRAKGGAYGAGISFDSSGIVTTYSYRDPNLEKTIATYDGMAEYLRDLPLDDKDITNYIISTMTRFNPPQVASKINADVLFRHFTGASEEDTLKRMLQAIETKRGDLEKLADLLEEAMAKDYLSVFGNGDKIRSAQNLFTSIRPIKQN